jgi:predicted MFS family arabinose efflux permease
VQRYLFDPVKGGNEEELTAALQRGVKLPPMSVTTFVRNLMLPTAALMLLQTLPNTVPWGVLSAHLHDFMATDANLTMQQATSLLAIFGAGAALGGTFGGFIGAGIYAYERRGLPLFMGLTLSAAALLMKEVMMLDLTEPGAMQFAVPVLVLAGAFAAVNGANIRVVVLNLTSPESRGASIALLNFVNCIGRGFGPTIIEKWMTAYSINRRYAISTILNCWLLSGALLCIASATIAADEDKLKVHLQKIAVESESESRKDLI